MDARMKAVLSSCILRCLLGRRSMRPKRNDITEQQRLPKPAPMTERRRRGPLFLIFIIFRIMQVIRNIGERKRAVQSGVPAVENPYRTLITAFDKNALPCKSYPLCIQTQVLQKRKLCEIYDVSFLIQYASTISIIYKIY